jgi:hypothetical protein
MKNTILLFLILSTLSLSALELPQYEVVAGDTINLVDINDLKQGEWRMFAKYTKTAGYEPDQLVSLGIYKEDVREGLWEFFTMENELDYTSYFIHGIDTVQGAKNDAAARTYVKVLQEEINALKSKISSTEQVESSDALAAEKYEAEIKALKNSKSILLIIIGLLLIGFAIFFPKLLKKKST